MRRHAYEYEYEKVKICELDGTVFLRWESETFSVVRCVILFSMFSKNSHGVYALIKCTKNIRYRPEWGINRTDILRWNRIWRKHYGFFQVQDWWIWFFHCYNSSRKSILTSTGVIDLSNIFQLLEVLWL